MPGRSDTNPWARATTAALAAVAAWALLVLGVVRFAGTVPSEGAGPAGGGGEPGGRDPVIYRGRVYLEDPDDPSRLTSAPGCRVRAVQVAEPAVFAEASCGADGTYRLAVTDPPEEVEGPGWAVEVEVPGHLRAVLVPPAPSVEEGVGPLVLPAVALGPAVRLSGRVEDPEGRPVPRVRVAARPVPDLDEPVPWLAATDDRGRFVFETLPAGPVDLAAWAPGYGGVGLVAWAPDDGVVLVLDPLQRVAGKVDGAGSQGVVRLAGDALWPPRATGWNDVGGFAFEDVPGTYFVLDAYIEGDDGGYAAPAVTYDPAEDPPPRLVLAPGGALAVRVTDGMGRPVAHATVTVRPGGLASLGRHRETGPDGWAVLSGLAPGLVTVTAAAEGFESPPPVEADVAPGETGRVRVRLLAPGRVEGRVVDPRGRGVAGADVYLEPLGTRAPGAARSSRAFGAMAFRAATARLSVRPEVKPVPALAAVGERAARSDGEGRFEVPGLSPGRYRVRASAPGFARSRPVEVRVPAGGAPPLVRVVLGDGHRVTVRVLDGNLRPVEGAQVTFDDGGFAVTGPDGVADLGVFAGRAALWVTAPGHGPQRVVHRVVGDTEIEVPLASADGRVEVRVRGRNLQPVAGATVILRTLRPEPERVERTDGKGIARFTGLARDAYLLRAEAAGHAPTAEVPVEAGPQGPLLELRLSPARTLRVDVRDADTDRGLARAQVTVRWLRPVPGLRRGVTDERGLVEVADLPGTPVEVEARAPEYVAARMEVDLSEEGGHTLVLRLSPAGAVEGVLRDDLGRPVPAVTVRVETPGGRVLARAVTDGGGRFAADGLPEGPVVLRAAPPPDLGAVVGPAEQAADVLARRVTRGVDLRYPRR